MVPVGSDDRPAASEHVLIHSRITSDGKPPVTGVWPLHHISEHKPNHAATDFCEASVIEGVGGAEELPFGMTSDDSTEPGTFHGAHANFHIGHTHVIDVGLPVVVGVPT